MCEIIFADDSFAARFSLIHQACFEKPWDESSMRQVLRLTGAFGFLALDKQKNPVGMIVCTLNFDEAEIVTLGVVPSCRRQGIAKKLLDRALAYARAGNANGFFLEVAVDNVSAATLYERAGFKKIGVRKDYYHTPRGLKDATVMKLSL